MTNQACPFIAEKQDDGFYLLLGYGAGFDHEIEEGYGLGTLEELGLYIENRYGWHSHEMQIRENATDKEIGG